ncbi:MAG: hypothetical protein AAGK97_01530 [Bacteroidota bacterium]
MRHLIRTLFVLLAIAALTSCTKDSSTDTCVCTRDYAPVYDKDGIKYANACLAECAGVQYSEFAPMTKATIWQDLTQENPLCSWYIRIGDKDYKMRGVDKDLYKNGLVVDIVYKEDLTPSDLPCNFKDGAVYIDHLEINE